MTSVKSTLLHHIPRSAAAWLATVALVLAGSLAVLAAPGMAAPAAADTGECTTPSAPAANDITGCGTATSPWLISDTTGMNYALGTMMKTTTPYDEGAEQSPLPTQGYYQLTANIDYGWATITGDNGSCASAGAISATNGFQGVLDGAGHTISNVTLPINSSSRIGIWYYGCGATIENLTFDGMKAPPAATTYTFGLFDWMYGGTTVRGVSLLNIDLEGPAYAATAIAYDLEAGNEDKPIVIEDDVVQGTIVGSVASAVGGMGGGGEGAVDIRNNYFDVDVTGTASTSGASTAGVLSWTPTAATATTKYPSPQTVTNDWEITNNVVQGSVTLTGAAAQSSASTHSTGPLIGYALPAPAGWSATDNLVDVATTNMTAGTPLSTTSTSQQPDGTAVSSATLAAEATYAGSSDTTATDPTTGNGYDDLGWNLGATVDGATPPDDASSAWSWSGSASNGRPEVAGIPTLTSANGSLQLPASLTADTVTSTAVATAASSAGVSASYPDGAADNDASYAVDTSAVTWGTTGANPNVTLTVGAQGFSATQTVGVQIVPATTIQLANATAEVGVGDTVTSDLLVADSGATLSDGSGHPVTANAADIAAIDTSTPSTGNTVTLTGTDTWGVQVTRQLTVDVVDTAIDLGTDHVYFTTAQTPDEQAVLTALGATLSADHAAGATPTITNFSAITWGTPGDYTVTVADSAGADGATPVQATVSVVPVPQITTSKTTVAYAVGATLTPAMIVADSGAKLTDGNGHVIGTVSATAADVAAIDTSTPSSGNAVTLTGTATGTGVAAAPVQIAVDIVVVPTVQVANPVVVISSAEAAANSDLTSDASLVADFGATITNADQVPGATLSVDASAAGSFSSPYPGSPTTTSPNNVYTVTVQANNEGVESPPVSERIVVTEMNGSGTAADPWQIADTQDWDYAFSDMNAYGSVFQDGHYQLTDNLDFGGAQIAVDTGASQAAPFAGVLDGDGHAISNLTNNTTHGCGTPCAAIFHSIGGGAIIENLTINGYTSNFAGNTAVLAIYPDGGTTVSNVSILNADVTSTTNSAQGLFLNPGSTNASYPQGDIVVRNTVVQGDFTGMTAAAGYSTNANAQPAGDQYLIEDDYFDVDLTVTGTSTAASGGKASAGIVGFAQNTTTDGTMTIADNVVRGSLSFPNITDSGSVAADSYGPVFGNTPTSTVTTTDNLVSNDFAITFNSALTGPPAVSDTAGTNGTVVDDATLDQPATYSGTATGLTDDVTSAASPPYTYDQLGWDFTGDPSATPAVAPTWWWDSDHPALTAVATLVTVAHPIAAFSGQLSEAPTDQQVLAALGASATVGASQLTISYNDINWGQPGTYTATIDDPVGDGASATATIVVAPLAGSGTAADPWQIGNVADWKTVFGYFSNIAVQSAFLGGHYVLTNDINFEGQQIQIAATSSAFFTGTFDGAGHTIYNMVDNQSNQCGTACTALFRYTGDGAVIENLGIDGWVSDYAGNDAVLVVYAYGGTTIQNVSIRHAKVTSATLSAQAIMYQPGSSSTYAGQPVTVKNCYVQGDFTGATGAAAVSTYMVANPYVITGNYFDVNVTATGSAITGGGSTSAAGIAGYAGSGATVTLSNNVLRGSLSLPDATTASDIGPVFGDVPGTSTDNLVSNDFTVTDAGATVPASSYSTTISGPNANGIVVDDAQTLDRQDTFSGTATSQTDAVTQNSYDQLGWDFAGDPSASPAVPAVWSWDDQTDPASPEPVLGTIPSILIPTLTLQNSTVSYEAGDPPTDDQIAAQLGATTTPAGATVSLEWGNVTKTAVGTFTIDAVATLDGIGSIAVPVTIGVLPQVTISVATTDVEYVAGSTVSDSQLLSDVGAAMSQPGTLSVDWGSTDLATPGTYQATVNALDDNGYHAAPVTITVTVTDPATLTQPPGPSRPTPAPKTATGGPAVGVALRVNPAMYAGESHPTFQWLLDGTPIRGATRATYTPTGADVGRLVQVRVTATPQGGTPTATVSAAVTIGAGRFTTPRSGARVTGTFRVGATVRAAAGSVSPSPQGVGYRWLRGQFPIKGATHATYTLVAADRGKRISVEVDLVSTGYRPASERSGAHTVAWGTLHAGKPSITGKVRGAVRVGRRLTVHAGSWTTGTKLSYHWLRAGKAIRGATRPTYKPTRADRHRRLAVRITGRKPGYRTLTRTVKLTGRVK